MNHWAFIWAAYGITLAATFGTLANSLFAMRTAEKASQRVGARS
ncbi:MAG: heme exporter protein CcmD [Sphingopyxis sp.]|nr:heme exporter protein CcmD [Sphingopyxis sp.]